MPGGVQLRVHPPLHRHAQAGGKPPGPGAGLSADQDNAGTAPFQLRATPGQLAHLGDTQGAPVAAIKQQHCFATEKAPGANGIAIRILEFKLRQWLTHSQNAVGATPQTRIPENIGAYATQPQQPGIYHRQRRLLTRQAQQRSRHCRQTLQGHPRRGSRPRTDSEKNHKAQHRQQCDSRTIPGGINRRGGRDMPEGMRTGQNTAQQKRNDKIAFEMLHERLPYYDYATIIAERRVNAKRRYRRLRQRPGTFTYSGK